MSFTALSYEARSAIGNDDVFFNSSSSSSSIVKRGVISHARHLSTNLGVVWGGLIQAMDKQASHDADEPSVQRPNLRKSNLTGFRQQAGRARAYRGDTLWSHVATVGIRTHTQQDSFGPRVSPKSFSKSTLLNSCNVPSLCRCPITSTYWLSLIITTPTSMQWNSYTRNKRWQGKQNNEWQSQEVRHNGPPGAKCSRWR